MPHAGHTRAGQHCYTVFGVSKGPLLRCLHRFLLPFFRPTSWPWQYPPSVSITAILVSQPILAQALTGPNALPSKGIRLAQQLSRLRTQWGAA